MIRAVMALEHKNADQALELLRVAKPYELSASSPIPLGPIYFRAQAYVTLHDGSAALSEFQKILDHPGVMARNASPAVGPLVRLGLARAFALQGDAAKARAAYENFLTLWKDADPDIPILKQAKAEYAKLQ